MTIKTKIGKVLAASAVAGAVALGAVGFTSTASADGPPGTVAVPTIQRVHVGNGQYVSQVVYTYRYVAPYTNNVTPVGQYPFHNPYVYNGYAAPLVYSAPFVFAPAPAITATQFSVITAAASVMNVSRGDVVASLQQGKTITQIAAERGVQRTYLHSAIVNNLQANVNAAVASGSLSGVTGNVLRANLSNRVANAIDQSGTANGTAIAAIEVQYQLLG